MGNLFLSLRIVTKHSRMPMTVCFMLTCSNMFICCMAWQNEMTDLWLFYWNKKKQNCENIGNSEKSEFAGIIFHKVKKKWCEQIKRRYFLNLLRVLHWFIIYINFLSIQRMFEKDSTRPFICCVCVLHNYVYVCFKHVKDRLWSL